MASSQPYTFLIGQWHALGAAEFVPDPAYLTVIRHISAFFPDITGGDIEIIDSDSSATVAQPHAGPSTSGLWIPTDVRIALRAGVTYLVTGSGSPDLYLTGYRFRLP